MNERGENILEGDGWVTSKNPSMLMSEMCKAGEFLLPEGAVERVGGILSAEIDLFYLFLIS